MSIQNLENGRVNINPLNLKVDFEKLENPEKVANGQLSWQFVKKGYFALPDTQFTNLIDPDDLCLTDNFRGRLRIQLKVKANAMNANNATWVFQFLTGPSPGTPLTLPNYKNTGSAATTSGPFYFKSGGVAPGQDLYSLINWDLVFNPSPEPAAASSETTILYSFRGGMCVSGNLMDSVWSGNYIDLTQATNITGIQIGTNDNGALNQLDYAIYVKGP